jgi:hypothetical protein
VGITVKNVVNSNNMRQGLRLTFRDEYDRSRGFDDEGNSYTKDNFEINLHANFGYQRNRASATAASNLDTYNFSYGVSANYNFWFGLNLSTDINQNSRRGYAEAIMNTNQWIWNAQASYSFLKRRQAILTLRWNDILGQRDMVSRNISATARTDSDSERIVSYGMLTFTYRFNMFGGRNVGGNRERNRERGEDGDGEGSRDGGNRGERPQMTEEQRAEMQAKMKERMEERRAAEQERHEATAKKYKKILTAEQYAKWEEMEAKEAVERELRMKEQRGHRQNRDTR